MHAPSRFLPACSHKRKQCVTLPSLLLPLPSPVFQSVGIAAPFLKYDRKGLDVTIEFKSKLSKEEGEKGGMEGRGGGGNEEFFFRE